MLPPTTSMSSPRCPPNRMSLPRPVAIVSLPPSPSMVPARVTPSLILNTSYNLHGFPIAYGPEDALEVFNSSGLNYLGLGNYLVTKK